MNRLSILTLLILIIGFFVLGCSSSKTISNSQTDPVSMTAPTLPGAYIDRNRSILESGTLEFDLESLSAVAIPDRIPDMHFNAARYVGLNFSNVSYNPTSHIASLDVTITNKSIFTGYDVRLIIFSDTIGHKLLNFDGYTHLWKAAGTDYVNPYITYAWDQLNHQFAPNDSYTRNLRVLLPGGNRAVHYSIDVSWPGPCTDCLEYYEYESNDVFEQANPLPMTYNQATDYFIHTGKIAQDDQDWFVIILEKSEMGITLVAPALDGTDDIVLSLYDDEMNLVESRSAGAGMCTWVSTPYTLPDMAGTYYVQVTCTGGEYDYELSPLRWPDWSEGFTFFETEYNGESIYADPMPVDYDPDSDSANYTGELASDIDWFRIEIPSDGVLALHLVDYDCASNEEVYITLYTSTGYTLQTNKIWYSDGNVAICNVVEPGTYYVKMDANSFTHRYVFEPIFVAY